MFAYCGNNPVAYSDSEGTIRSYSLMCADSGGTASNMKRVIKAVKESRSVGQSLGAILGAKYRATSTVTISKDIIPNPSPIVVQVGTRITETYATIGNDLKLISVYINRDISMPIASSAGLKINIGSLTFNVSMGYSNMGGTLSFSNNDIVYSYGIKADLSNWKVGCEGAISRSDGYNTYTDYCNVSANVWSIIAAIMFLQSGQVVPAPNQAF